jgi:nucleoside phosphorylase
VKILVTFAVQAEFAPLKRIREFSRISQTEFLTQSGGDSEVHVAIIGIGARKFHLPSADLCIASGVAGSLKTQYGIGTVLVARAVKRKDSETIIASDESLVRIAIQCGAKPVDFFCTTDNIVSSVSEKSGLGRIADAVDMESYPVFAEARRQGIPVVAIRTISDAADQEIPLDFSGAVNQDGKLEWIPALSQIAASPGRIPQLMRFGLESSRAARELAHFLDKYLKCLTYEGHLIITTGMENRGG